ncbi:hypothetical protein WN944_026963 [Citrus x changshan-huyou]|uniref:Uncharacterized protein n=1 Tax=Citrus x changshan-huyou TaxID=2935761 RepID=A0AAP0LMU1_9ROSI
MMDKTWVQLKRNTKEYREGVKKFVENATLNVENQDGMDMSYTRIWHGEQLGIKDTDVEMTNTYSMSRDVDDHYRGIHENVDEQQDNCPLNFVEDAETPLYPGCSRY